MIIGFARQLGETVARFEYALSEGYARGNLVLLHLSDGNILVFSDVIDRKAVYAVPVPRFELLEDLIALRVKVSLPGCQSVIAHIGANRFLRPAGGQNPDHHDQQPKRFHPVSKHIKDIFLLASFLFIPAMP